MPFNVQSVIQAISKAAEMTPEERRAEGHRPVVTVSRDHGSGGDEIAAALAQRLGVPLYGRDILEAVAKHVDVDSQLLQDLHEKVTRASDSWLYSMVFGKNVTRSDYQKALVTVLRGIYHAGGVIVGRGAHVVLAGRDVLRVRVVGSVDACARRVAHLDHIDEAEAKRAVRDENARHAKFVYDMFRSRLNDPTTFDVTVNTDHFPHYEQVVEMMMSAIRMMGLDEPNRGTSRK